MKTEKEIKRMLKIHKEFLEFLQKTSSMNYFSIDITNASIEMLEWVLSD